jgi:hypothetical protein
LLYFFVGTLCTTIANSILPNFKAVKSVEPTNTLNVLLVKGFVSKAEPKLLLQVKSPASQVACPVRAACLSCTEADQQLCDTFVEDFDIFAHNSAAYNSQLVYRCQPGANFDNGLHEHRMTCHWNGSWEGDGSSLTSCKGTTAYTRNYPHIV